MTTSRNITRLVLAAGAVLLASVSAAAGEQHRIVCADGITTEIIFALGAGDWVVARDSGSTYPPGVEALPNIGDGHQINPEAILSHKPTAVIGLERPMSQPAFHILESARVKVMRLNSEPCIETAKENIETLAAFLGKEAEGKALIAALDADLKQLKEKQAAMAEHAKPRILVVYLRPNATLLMGEDSNAAALARLAGAEFAIPEIAGYKPLNAEAVVAAAPDVLLCYKGGLTAVGGVDALYRQPGISQTPAARNRRVIAMNDLLLGGFGPRAGKALLELHHALYETEGPYISGAKDGS